MAQPEKPCFAKNYRSDVHFLVDAGGFIAVPAHTVSAVPVEIKQHGIKFNTGMLLHTFPDLEQ